MMSEAAAVLDLEWNDRQRAVMAILVENVGQWVPTRDLIDAFYRERSRPRHAVRNFENLKANMRVKTRRVGFTIANDPLAARGQKWTRTRLEPYERNPTKSPSSHDPQSRPLQGIETA